MTVVLMSLIKNTGLKFEVKQTGKIVKLGPSALVEGFLFFIKYNSLTIQSYTRFTWRGGST